jgi:hypothetical protein
LVESGFQVGEGAGTLKPMLAHQQKCHTKQNHRFYARIKYREGRDSEEMRLKVQQALKDIYPESQFRRKELSLQVIR